jgi:uncharacterized protein YaaR (DUF327 family)
MELTNLGQVGWVKEGHDIITFQLGEGSSSSLLPGAIGSNKVFDNGPVIMQVDGLSVLLKGALNNEPEDIEEIIAGNWQLPELIEKQIKILYGKGPRNYTEDFDADHKLIRKWAKNDLLDSMFADWELSGLKSSNELAQAIIRRYYYFEEFYTKHFFSLSRLLDPKTRSKFNLPLPFRGMELVENKRARLASKKQINVFQDDYEEKDFDTVLVGNWNYGTVRKFKKYVKFLLSNALNNNVSIGHYKADSVGLIYGSNKLYRGTRDWILGSNLTPKNINSFIKHSLAAKVHVIIPEAWCAAKRIMLQKYCEINQRLKIEGKTLLKINGIEIGEEYHEHLFTLYVNAEVKKLIAYLSGAENQGKAFVSYSFRTGDKEEERWKFETIDLKYKEYITGLLDYHKEAANVLTQAKGIDGSISNITKDGVISKSGADLYYNYIIYLVMNLPIAEEICMKPFNDMIRINYPELYKAGWRRGLYNDIPKRQEDTAPNDRLQNSLNTATATLIAAVAKSLELQNKVA